MVYLWFIWWEFQYPKLEFFKVRVTTLLKSPQILPFDLPFQLFDVPKFSTKLAIHTEANGRSIIARQFQKAPRLGRRLPPVGPKSPRDICQPLGKWEIDTTSVLCVRTLNFYRVTNENKEDQ